MPRYFQLFRFLLIPSAAILLLHAFVYGPGRGITMIPEGNELSELLYCLRMLVYGLFLAGALVCVKRPLLASALLAGGMLGRVVMEYFLSALQEWIGHFSAYTLGGSAFIATFYLVSFVLPAALCSDSFRVWRMRRAKAQDCKSPDRATIGDFPKP